MTVPITPIEYRLRIKPDLDRFLFSGRVILSANADAPITAATLDCAELAIWKCQIIREKSGGKHVGCAFTQDPANESLTIHLPEAHAGYFQLIIEYTGKINDRMAGFYRSRIATDNGPEHIAVTQFQESDARRAFPCFDHPSKKAVFSLEMEIDAKLCAISNTDIKSIDNIENGRQRVCFDPTPKMSTYLLFFGVGPFEIHADTIDPRVRAVCLPGMEKQTVFGREFGRRALAYGEAYYDIDYPLAKMDLIAVPDFAFGAMENWGAITFRENLLLNVPGVTSREAQTRICEVIAHEITHQWFGNLVTPEDWKYLWLNESFATYFGYGIVNHYYPEWQIWHQFVRSQTETALNRDALHETFAIEMPGNTQVAITTSTAPIIYSKGGSVLRQLEAWIGPDKFKAGLRRYLADFAYGCAASHHLWESLSAESGMPVDDLMQNWVTQPGFPVVTVERSGSTLVLTQRRFTCLPNDAAQTWMIPVTVTAHLQDGEAETQTFLFGAERFEISLPPGTSVYRINPGYSGFYHVDYKDEVNLNRLGNMAARRQLPIIDRWGLQNDLFALVNAGQLPMAAFVAMAEKYIGEREYLPLASLDSHLFEACLVLRGAIRDQVADLAVKLMNAAIDAIGQLPSPQESQTTAMLRDQLYVHGALMGNQPILDFLGGQYRQWLDGAEISADIVSGVTAAAAVSGDRSTLNAMIHRFESSQVEHERMTLAGSLGRFGQWPLLEQALEYTLEKLPDRIRFIPLVSAAGNPTAMDRLWVWFEANVAHMEKMHPLLFERVVAAFVPGPGLDDPQRSTEFCTTLEAKNPQLKDVIALSLERLAINARFREHGHASG
jgi:aminopeptidase N